MMFNIQRAPDGMLLGVCKGIARSRELPVTAVRLAAVALTMVMGFWPGIALYILAAALMEAAAPQGEPSGEHVPDSPAERARLMRDMKERILRLDKRIQRMEDQVVRPDFQWDSRWGRERSTSARVEKTGHGAAFPRAE